MMRINLLPHRAEKRQARQAQFIAFSVISVLMAGLLVGFVQIAIGTQISYQERRNTYLKLQTAILDKQIAEIKKLQEQTEALLARKNVVESLQSTRSDVVHLLDQMLRILPDGIYLKTLEQKGYKITLVGFSQSNARISTFMRAIEDSPWLDSPNLVEIHAVKAKGNRLSQFTMKFNLTKPKADVKARPANTAKAKR